MLAREYILLFQHLCRDLNSQRELEIVLGIKFCVPIIHRSLHYTRISRKLTFVEILSRSVIRNGTFNVMITENSITIEFNVMHKKSIMI